MKSSRTTFGPEAKNQEFSLGDITRVKLPRLQKPVKKSKKPITKAYSRNECPTSKYDQLVEEIIDLQNCVSRKYGKGIKIDSLRKMQTSISSFNQGIQMVNRSAYAKSAKEPVIRSTSSSDTDESSCPATKEVSKWSRRLYFKRRLEMGNRNLIIINFEGVIGDVFKDNFWQDSEEMLHLRKGTIKGLKLLLASFQVVLFFHTSRIPYATILKYFASKSVFFDAIYASENSAVWTKKSIGRFKKPLKYSEHVQNYSQVSIDFGIQHEVLGKMLIVTSICLDHDEHFTAGANLIIKDFQAIPQYLCKAVPVLKSPDMLLPITLAIPDPRIANEGDSFFEIAKLIDVLSQFSLMSEECSWLDGFARIRAEPQMNSIAFESTAYQYALAKEKVVVSKEQADNYKEFKGTGCLCPNEIRNSCKMAEVGQCLSLKKMKGYLIIGKGIPKSMLKNKFIVFKLHQPHAYKIVRNFGLS